MHSEAASPQVLLKTAAEAALRAGAIMLDNRGTLSASDITVKQAFDFVTRVDNECERTIIEIIKSIFPDHHFLAEESLHDTETEDYRWIIDPLDGTTNYIHGFPMSCVSIAVQYRREIIAGAIYDPFRKELFTAIKGQGAYLNGNIITASSVTDPGKALIATGFPFKHKKYIDKYLDLFKNIFLQVSDIRRAGAAAIDLAYIACGRLDGFFEIGLLPWDCAAGSLIIKEAGGIITNFGSGDDMFSTGNLVAGNLSIHAALLKEVKGVFGGTLDK